MKNHFTSPGWVARTGLWLLLVAGALDATVQAATDLGSPVLQQIKALQDEKAARTPAQIKMDSQLVYATKADRHETIATNVPMLKTSVNHEADGTVLVDVTANLSPSLLKQIVKAGGTIVSSAPRFHAARLKLPLNQLELIASHPDLKFMQRAVGSYHRTGSVNSEGDITHRAALGRSTFRVDGSGVNVGVLSTSVDFYTNSQASGDLPTNNFTIIPQQSGIPNTGEGTAMLEIVHDIAPGAGLFFATGEGGPANFANNILLLRAAGCDIIADDLGYFNETPFQDGIIAQAVNTVVADGALYFSSAGNEGNKNKGTSGTWQGDFVDGGAVTAPFDGKGGNVHNFGATTYDTVTGLGMATVLFWADPLGASTNDYDLYVLDSTGANIISSSTTIQNGTQDPFEIVEAPAVGDRIVIVKASGEARMIHVDTIRGNLSINTEGNTKGHASAAGAYCVAAVDIHTAYPNPFNGGSPNPVESFSSDGPRKMFFQADGTPYTPGNFLSAGGITRQKPDIAAADGVETSVPGFQPFYGTSAAAPHAAAIAALVKSYNPGLSADEMRFVLTNSALNIEGLGIDRDSGAGIVMALNALQICPIPIPTPNVLVNSETISGGNGNGLIDYDECNDLTIILTNRGSAPATTIQATLSTATPGVIIAQPTVVYPDLPALSAAGGRTLFKVSTQPTFVCGTTINFSLLIKADQFVRTNFFQIGTGTTGVPTRYDNGTAYSIPDFDTNGVDSPIIVTNFNSAIARVAVSLNITHPFDFDLNMELISPDGTAVSLADFEGGSGHNFGAACSPDSLRTTFDDTALFPISLGNAPFTGTFRPEQPLSVYNLKNGTNVNGTWRLHVVDQIPLDQGAIDCWSLILYPVDCTDGGGECPGADLGLTMTALPNPVKVGSNLTYTIVVTNSGPGSAKGVIVNQTLPANSLFVSATTSQGSATLLNGSIAATLGTLPVGATAVVSVVVIPTVPGVVTSTANVGSPTSDFNPANNSATVSTSVQIPTADLAVSITAAPSPVLAGGNLTYTITITNNGPFTGSGATLILTLPLSATTVVPLPGNFVNAGTSAPGSYTVIGSLGSIPVGTNIVITTVVRPGVVGIINASAQISLDGNTSDPFTGNNFSSVSTTVNPAADVAVTIIDAPDPVITGSNYTYYVAVTNNGPTDATGVILNQTLPQNLPIVSVTANVGSAPDTSVPGSITWTIPSLLNGAGGLMTIMVTAPSTPSAFPITSTAVVSAQQGDANLTNNTFVATTTVSAPTVTVVPAGVRLTAESISPADGALEAGETVTAQFSLQNTGNIPSSNLVATLLAINGVTLPSGPQIYGTLLPGSAAVSFPFTFTSAGTNGGTVTATLQLQNAGTNFGTVTFPFVLPVIASFSNTTPITIVDNAPASPYPSSITVSNVTGFIGKVSVTLSNFNHTFPDDVDILLVHPSGRTSILMSDAGGRFSVNNSTLTFDRTATSVIPDDSQIVAATYQPADYEPGDTFPTNAPAGPYVANLAAFEGINANGKWSLYVVDDTAGDAGAISNGWSLTITTISPANKVADLAVTASASSNQFLLGSTVTYTVNVTNNGPDTATAVILTNVLPAGVSFSAAATPQGSFSQNGQSVKFSLGSISAATGFSMSVTGTVAAAGSLTNQIGVAGTEIDPNLLNNSASVILTAALPPADLAAAASVTPNPVIVGSNLVYTLSVTNNGPNTALNVTGALNRSGMTFVSAVASQGIVSTNANAILCTFGNLPVGNIATVTLTMTPVSLGTLTSVWSVAGSSFDAVVTNNSVTNSITVTPPAPRIVAGGTFLLSENGLQNAAVDSNETVTVSFTLNNVGVASTTNLVAAMQFSGGVTPITATRTYGAIAAGSSGAQSFTFVGAGPAGSNITATLSLTDNSFFLGNVTFNFRIPGSFASTNVGGLIIPSSGPASPYPSVINVSGFNGYVSKVTVRISGFTHSFPDDIDMILVNPTGQKVILMSDVGGAHSVTNLDLVFSDNATASLPDVNPLTSGSYKPTDFELGDIFPGLSGVPTGTNLAALNGFSPNGNWSLYVVDDTAGDAGSISNWSLALTAADTINPAANLSVTSTDSPDPVFAGNYLTYSINVINHGPAAANNVILNDTLPAGSSIVSALTTQGTVNTSVAGTVSCAFGTIPADSSASASIQIRTGTASASVTNTASVTSDAVDLNLSDNVFAEVTFVADPPAANLVAGNTTNGLVLTLLGQPGQPYAVQVATNLTSSTVWTSVSTNVAGNDGTFTYTEAVTNAQRRFYRAMRLAQ